MPHSKTIDQLRADLAEMKRLAAKPGIPDNRRRIYETTAATIQEELDRRARAAQPVRHVAPPPPIRPPAETREPRPAAFVLPDPSRATPPPIRPAEPAQDAAAACSVHIEAAGAGGTPRVVIDWGHGNTSTLTEGEARSGFTSRLRDLAQSRLVSQGRLEHLPQYDTFHRAVVFYQALTVFWGRKPSPRDLDLGGMTAQRRAIFDMIAARVTESAQVQHP